MVSCEAILKNQLLNTEKKKKKRKKALVNYSLLARSAQLMLAMTIF